MPLFEQVLVPVVVQVQVQALVQVAVLARLEPQVQARCWSGRWCWLWCWSRRWCWLWCWSRRWCWLWCRSRRWLRCRLWSRRWCRCRRWLRCWRYCCIAVHVFTLTIFIGLPCNSTFFSMTRCKHCKTTRFRTIRCNGYCTLKVSFTINIVMIVHLVSQVI